jgi:FAD/FMN-containing dehydrogenase
MALTSWGQLPTQPAADERLWAERNALLPVVDGTLLPYGNGRSYGDVCLNSGGTLLNCRGLQRFIAFDAENGLLTCEAGVLLADILQVFVPRGWFLPVTPGTRFVTVGGAIANDVHGKNHHRAGTFGRFVRRFELLRSDGSRRVCSLSENAEWFAATIGGLGLTGLLTWVEIELRRITSPEVVVENQRFTGLDEFFALNEEAEARHVYTVAWIDCLANPPRGILMGGDHATTADSEKLAEVAKKPLTFPMTPPISLINGLSLRAFNFAYFHRPLAARAVVHYEPYFYPLDGILHWNRLYGRQGFYQYQCVLPLEARPALADLLRSIVASGQGSFLAVLKTFGALPSPGLLSFPQPGMTLALDFPNRGTATLALFDRLDAIVEAAGGRLYAGKDARMSGAFFRRSYPRFDEFSNFIDPKFSSDFWRRMAE